MQNRVSDETVQTGGGQIMIIDYNKSKNITEEERLVSLRDSVQRALDETTQAINATVDQQKQHLTEKIDTTVQNVTVVRKTAHRAYADAGEALRDADEAHQYADLAKGYAMEAKETTDIINGYAEEVDKSVRQILEDGETAGIMAQQAVESAGIASASASSAIEHLSVVEDIVGVLEMLATNGVYTLTQDTEVQPNKWYFTLTGTAVSNPTGNPHQQGWYELSSGVYSLTEDTTVTSGKTYYTVVASAVANPVDADIATYYELVSIDDAIQNFVSSHLALSNEGLSLQTSEGEESTRVLLSTTEGLVLYNENGIRVASYGTEARIGSPSGFHITVTPNYNNTGKPRLSFWRGTENYAENEVAYISDNKLYITQSVVLQQMDVGTKVADGGLGQWSWKVHEVGGANNLYLKWLG